MNRNPVLNSPDDITAKLIQQIISNDLDSLTINYEFTSKFDNSKDLEDYKKEQMRINPFWRANNITPIKRIEFEIRLGKNVHSLAGAFREFEELEYVNIQDTSHVTDMSFMFFRAKSFNQPIASWDTSKVTNMGSMFRRAESFNQPIGNWNTSKVLDMGSMFRSSRSFNQPIGNWDTSNVHCMSFMFCCAEKFNQPIGNWDTSEVITMESMFEDAKSFNQPIGNWDISNVKNKQAMFKRAFSYKHPKPRKIK